MIENAIKMLNESSCASIKYRLKNEITGEAVSYDSYIESIKADSRVHYALQWQKDDGYFGDVFHGGWIPKEDRKYSATGAETALRFLYEMGFCKNEPCISKGLNGLLNKDWNKGKGSWSLYEPEIGLFGDDRIRAVIFAYYGIENIDFIKSEVNVTIALLKKVQEFNSLDEVVEEYKGKKIYRYGKPLPEIYHIKLLAYTKSWRSEQNLSIVENAIRKLILISPLPEASIRYKSQLIAPARIYPRNLRLILDEIKDNEWFEWFHTFELFARMGMVERIGVLKGQADQLLSILEHGKGLFTQKPKGYGFTKWGTYTGLALEENWREKRWINDLTFRSLLILKYSNLLKF